MVSVRRHRRDWRPYLASAGLILAVSMVDFAAAKEPIELNPPAPASADSGPSSAQVNSQDAETARANQRGTETSPLVARVLLPPRTSEEAAQDAQDRRGKIWFDWSILGITGTLAIIGAAQILAFSMQAKRLRQTIAKLDETAASHASDMSKYIFQVTRSAVAMENIAGSIAQSAESARTSVQATKDIADKHNEFGQLQMQAYVAVATEGLTYQDNKQNLKLEVKTTISNKGNTPAYEVNSRIMVDILPFPIPKDFAYPLLESSEITESIFVQQDKKTVSFTLPGKYQEQDISSIKYARDRVLCAWGIVSYMDAFNNPRITKFCHIMKWLPDDQIVGHSYGDHNESD